MNSFHSAVNFKSLPKFRKKTTPYPTNPLNDLFAPTSNHFLQPNGAIPAYHAEYPPKPSARTISRNGNTMDANIA
ncbi:MAG: hypothetical protein IPN33_04375 [Saprospiraceae bacterium]|nr:hypothetical protein [Saprospiraceae bacterium]